MDLIDRQALLWEFKTNPKYHAHVASLAQCIHDAPSVDAMILPCKLGGVVFVDSRTLPTHRLDVDEEEIPEYIKATVVSIRQNSKGWFFKVSIWAKWLVPEWDAECGTYEVGREKMRYFTYPASAIGKTVFLTHEEPEAALEERRTDG